MTHGGMIVYIFNHLFICFCFSDNESHTMVNLERTFDILLFVLSLPGSNGIGDIGKEA